MPITEALPWHCTLQTKEVTISVFGRPHNYQMRVYRPEDLQDPERKDRFLQISAAAKRCGIKEILMPVPTQANARICKSEQLDVAITLPGEITIKRSQIYEADGIELPRGPIAVGVQNADCPVLIATRVDTGRTVVAHAALNSLMDRKAALRQDGVTSRPVDRESIVDNLMHKLLPLDPKLIKISVVAYISPEHYTYSANHNNPEIGRKNRRIIEHIVTRWGKACIPGELNDGHIDLIEIIRRQFEKYGVKRDQVSPDGKCTFSERMFGNGPMWHSNARDRQKAGRNLVLVYRN